MCLNSSPLAVLWECVGSTLSSLISSPVPSLKPQGQLPPTSGPVIYWAPLYCLWLPSGCLSGLRFSQTTASLRIIIRLRPAVWHTSTRSLLLIEFEPMQEVTEKGHVISRLGELKVGSEWQVCMYRLSGFILSPFSIGVKYSGQSAFCYHPLHVR